MTDSHTLTNAAMRAQSSLKHLESVRNCHIDMDEVVLRSIMNGFRDAAELIQIEIDRYIKNKPGSDLTLTDALHLEED